MANQYGIKVTHDFGQPGWIAGRDCKVLLFKTKQEAEKALNQMKKDPHYLWKCNAEVEEFMGFGKR